jgi:UDP-N-acetylglucosamine:LPS N-acetylglucosamine transferase
LTAGRLAAVTRELLADRARRDAMATAMRGLARPDAARRIVDCVLELAGVAPARAH